MTLLLLFATIVAAPSVRTERQREKEEEMIWRGKQYVRAIKLYYRKNGRFPTTFDDLIKPQPTGGSLRFLRQEYKDPMNKEDGTWRLILCRSRRATHRQHQASANASDGRRSRRLYAWHARPASAGCGRIWATAARRYPGTAWTTDHRFGADRHDAAVRPALLATDQNNRRRPRRQRGVLHS